MCVAEAVANRRVRGRGSGYSKAAGAGYRLGVQMLEEVAEVGGGGLEEGRGV